MMNQSDKEETVDYDFEDARKCFPVKITNADKKVYGKTLVIAGSKDIYGASFLCAKSCFLSGAGMVKVFTHRNNKYSLEHDLPEAMFSFYKNFSLKEKLKNSLLWADTVVVGPGLGFYMSSKRIMKLLPELFHKKQIVIMDADALNILSRDKSLLEKYTECFNRLDIKCVFTPHKDELNRLCKGLFPGLTEDEVLAELINKGIVVVKKGNNTHTYGKNIYVNKSGNEGMATAGSGDVLSGILGATLFRCATVSFDKRVAFAVYLHGLCGDLCKETINSISIRATDIMNKLPEALDCLEKA